MLLAVMKKLWSENLSHSLVVVGRAGVEEPADWGPGVVRVESVPQNQLAALYQHCELTVLPAGYAGSGLSVLEAMRAGSTVVCPRVGGIPEVAHTTPIYFNPDNAGDLAAAIRRGLSERPSERKNRHSAGRKIAREYTWEACTLKVLQALRRKP
jgi:glycosyltransferase involved in cell wall biosynthesis